ncbi:MAG: cytochrome c3 family protein [Acidobacteriota bacterium]
MGKRINLTIFAVFFIFLPLFLTSADNDTCMECHSDESLTATRGGREISMYVNLKVHLKSVHKEQDCVNCHEEADVEEFPHEERLAPVNCGNCHDKPQEEFDAGIHGKFLKADHLYAPDCTECHGKHNIYATKNPDSPSYRMKVPYLCGKCHREGAPVARIYKINERNIIENYSQSIHGEGLFKKGLTVSATCVDCHSSHKVLPHTNRDSSIHPNNIASTCMACHARIEDVHKQVIENKKWEKSKGAIPACTDCHLPHKVRKESIVLRVSDTACLKCHEDENISMNKDGKKISLHIKKEDIKSSVHMEVTCVKCHSDVNPLLKRPCQTANEVDCSSCHISTGEEYKNSGHGIAKMNMDKDAPDCVSCHGTHTIQSHRDDTSPIYKTNIPFLCGNCHKKDSKIEKGHELSQKEVINDYSQSIHGKKLTEKGFLVSASCTDCHNKHYILSSKDEKSSTHIKNVQATCSSCHRGIFNDYIKSIHFTSEQYRKEDRPTCITCHSAHKITDITKDQFMTEVTDHCGECHKELSETYLDTVHGKTYQLGYLKSAKCSDCHNAHLILSTNDPDSSVGMNNIVNTCQKCHEDANERFTGYLTHATHHDRNKFPILYYTYWAMTLLLISVFTFFGIHTILWFPRSFKNMKLRKKEGHGKDEVYVQRFELSQRMTHLFVILSFLALAFTGLILKFSFMPWAAFFANAIGGAHNAGLLHRFAALVTFGYFFFHVFNLIKMKRKAKTPIFKFIFSKNGMMFNKKDLKDFWGSLKWFVGLGKRPQYGKWTYWEKFDYFAVFWGVAVIGISGLILWFPEAFTKILPGWAINVAMIIHSDEALLAIGFIFTIHFFNTHLRPESFPMDKVIFTGLVPLEEYKKDRPEEYKRLVESGELESKLVKHNAFKKYDKFVTFMGMTFLLIGLALTALIIYSMIFGYK